MNPTKYTIKLPQSGLDVFSGASQKKDEQVSIKKKMVPLEFKWDTTRKWSLADNKTGLFLNPPNGPKQLNASPHTKPPKS